jgi:putative ABC transport system permease protein
MAKIGHFNVVIEPLSKARLHSIADGYPEGRGNYQFLLIMVGLSVLIISFGCKLYQFGYS